jgi:hypothetical protein
VSNAFEIDHLCSKCKKHETKKFYYQEITNAKNPITDSAWQCKYCYAWQTITPEEVKILKQRAMKYHNIEDEL